MKIAIDVSPIVYNTGVSEYTSNLVRSLLDIDNVNEYKLFGGSFRRVGEIKDFFASLRSTSLLNSKFSAYTFPIAPSLADLIWNKLHIMPVERLVGQSDIYHSSDWSQAPSRAIKVTTVHDLVPLLYPNESHPKIVSVHRQKLHWVKKECQAIIAPSYTTKLDLIKLGFDENKITVIPEAPHAIYGVSSENSILNTKRHFNIKGDYLLAVGTAPRKNIDRIIDSYKKVAKESNLELVIVGYSHNSQKEVNGVKYLGYVHEKYISDIYRGAKVLVYPSLYEGFGLPILNAYKTGIPVVTSKLGSMEEIGGGAILVDPLDVTSISDGILEAINKSKQLVQKGKKIVSKYSWQETAKSTLNIYNSLI